MPICGFNEKMLEGLLSFDEGLVEHGLIERSKKNNETIDQGIKREISDMTRLLAEIPKIDDSAKRILTEGIVKYAMGFYMIMRRNDIKNYKEVIETTLQYFKSMDNKFYSELEGKPNDMKELVQHLNKIDLGEN
jgi:ribosomal protein S6